MSRWPATLVSLVICFSCQAAYQYTDLKAGDELIFFPGLCHTRDGQTWTLELQGCIFEPEDRTYAISALQQMLKWYEIELTEQEKANVARSARLFMNDNQRGRRAVVRLGSQVIDLGKTGPDGQFSGKVTLSDTWLQSTNRIVYEAELRPNNTRRVSGMAVVIPPTGWLVISDIDDTIKISQVTDRKQLLRKTFVDPFAPVPGMAAIYQAWATNSGAVFLYVSASPWQLFPPLQEFTRTSGFPDGVFCLKQFRLKDRTFRSLWENPVVYKQRLIEPLLEKLNTHQFVLVGDSGEKDPEIYAALQRKYPERIARILIRDTTSQKRNDERYQNLFKNIPAEIWEIFQDPNELSLTLTRARSSR